MGCGVATDELVVTNGAMEALNLCLEAVTRPGDLVAVVRHLGAPALPRFPADPAPELARHEGAHDLHPEPLAAARPAEGADPGLLDDHVAHPGAVVAHLDDDATAAMLGGKADRALFALAR